MSSTVARRRAAASASTVRSPTDAPDSRWASECLPAPACPAAPPAHGMAALYSERWEIEAAFDEFRTHLRGRQRLRRSRKPELARQEFHGLMPACFAMRKAMHPSAPQAGADSGRLSFNDVVCALRRQVPIYLALPPQRAGFYHRILSTKQPERESGRKHGQPIGLHDVP